MLSVKNLHVHYGSVAAVKGIDVELNEGEIVALIGANGAGKSTFLNAICGKPKPSAGSVLFCGTELSDLRTFEIVRTGIAYAPEGRRIFQRMTVLENLKMGATISSPSYFSEDLSRVFEMFPRLRDRKDQRAGTLSGGEQQMLAIARALMARPKLLLLDEPSLGLAPIIAKQIFSIIRDINSTQGVSVLLVEQNAHHALGLANHAYVLQNGRVSVKGTGAELLADPEVRAAYLEGAA
ncbi:MULTISPECIES: ABC transporter ATP-binding protein [unclassified Mesorhizobium]|uniref:ABC transporter ATP-binding protein n=1 Tax=unclassified Mesorhizobium TaxID=325217 RepID=UPI001092EAEF|nr:MULTISPECIES: ABC transporter ATP-binding protein [unclassified Mesorhizobium]TGS43758.1 ABC transporter ATP-binding protein [Mesorhizobium sp. M8A.F.Ca.ET.182.01.1.1]TGS78339.1 ABC transporter ATP-binding protein [Mesorhizobium sp. M8A.F.Ca.ET.181.01.1.1]TGV15477.1 ABC transporter ATP-binding protein [Mesorhizobium sp. M8A.F.Ca.ET.173.01.1.1]